MYLYNFQISVEISEKKKIIIRNTIHVSVVYQLKPEDENESDISLVLVRDTCLVV